MPGKLQRESGAQHPASGRGFEGGVHGAVTYVDKSLPSHPIQSLLAVRMASVMYPTDDTAEFDEAGANRVRVRSRQG